MRIWRKGGVALGVALLALCAFAAIGSAAQLVGTEGDDTLIGTEGPDYIAGHRGNDLLEGLAGRDLIRGGKVTTRRTAARART
jgi:Ca2+-binding RTX toxin-like protein